MSEEQTPFEGGGPVNPFSWPLAGGGTLTHPGMTLRDYFAAKALQGLLAHAPGMARQMTAPEMAYNLADAMLAARGGAA